MSSIGPSRQSTNHAKAEALKGRGRAYPGVFEASRLGAGTTAMSAISVASLNSENATPHLEGRRVRQLAGRETTAPLVPPIERRRRAHLLHWPPQSAPCLRHWSSARPVDRRVGKAWPPTRRYRG